MEDAVFVLRYIPVRGSCKPWIFVSLGIMMCRRGNRALCDLFRLSICLLCLFRLLRRVAP